jgi:uncharacterized membrane protein YdbT with pleckstrin-like domain
VPNIKTKEDRMSESEKDVSPEERAARGKRLLLYGMVTLVLVTFVAVFLSLYLVTGPLTGSAGTALQTAFIVSIITLIACAIVWFIYVRFILKE